MAIAFGGSFCGGTKEVKTVDLVVQLEKENVKTFCLSAVQLCSLKKIRLFSIKIGDQWPP